MFKVICISLCTIALCLTLLTALTLGVENRCAVSATCDDITASCDYPDWDPDPPTEDDCEAYWCFVSGKIRVYADCGGSGQWAPCN